MCRLFEFYDGGDFGEGSRGFKRKSRATNGPGSPGDAVLRECRYLRDLLGVHLNPDENLPGAVVLVGRISLTRTSTTPPDSVQTFGISKPWIPSWKGEGWIGFPCRRSKPWAAIRSKSARRLFVRQGKRRSSLALQNRDARGQAKSNYQCQGGIERLGLFPAQDLQ